MDSTLLTVDADIHLHHDRGSDPLVEIAEDLELDDISEIVDIATRLTRAEVSLK